MVSVILTMGMFIWGRDILLIFGASKDTIEYAQDYMQIYCLGTVFIQLALGLNSFISTQGFAKVSMINVTIWSRDQCYFRSNYDLYLSYGN